MSPRMPGDAVVATAKANIMATAATAHAHHGAFA